MDYTESPEGQAALEQAERDHRDDEERAALAVHAAPERTVMHYGSDGSAECGAHGDGRCDDAVLTKDAALVTCPTCRGWLPIVANWNPAALGAGETPRFKAGIDVLISVNGALHAVNSPWRIDVKDGQAIAVPTPECLSIFEPDPRAGASDASGVLIGWAERLRGVAAPPALPAPQLETIRQRATEFVKCYDAGADSRTEYVRLKLALEGLAGDARGDAVDQSPQSTGTPSQAALPAPPDVQALRTALRDLIDAIPSTTLEDDPPLHVWVNAAESALAASSGSRQDNSVDE